MFSIEANNKSLDVRNGYRNEKKKSEKESGLERDENSVMHKYTAISADTSGIDI